MNNEKRIKHLPMRKFQELFGVKKFTFYVMLMILEGAYVKKHAKGGRPPKISALDCLVITLQYYREYRAMEHIAFDYGVWKSTVCEVIKWTEQTLIKSGVFRLPSKRALFQDASLRVVL
ncbi:MAG: transposase family protein, partial [Abditibacteriota bacterium]|nr:transposase family protein [Abditibacteriota bacterium]